MKLSSFDYYLAIRRTFTCISDLLTWSRRQCTDYCSSKARCRIGDEEYGIEHYFHGAASIAQACRHAAGRMAEVPMRAHDIIFGTKASTQVFVDIQKIHIAFPTCSRENEMAGNMMHHFIN